MAALWQGLAGTEFAGALHRRIELGELRGWVVNEAAPAQIAEVDLFVDGTHAARIGLGVFRSGLAKGLEGPFGFRWPVPEVLLDGQPHEVIAAVADTRLMLPNSPLLLTPDELARDLVSGAASELRRGVAALDQNRGLRTPDG